MILTRSYLDEQTCSIEGCDCGGELYIHGTCHLDSPTVVSYYQGILAIQCYECNKVIAQIAVADHLEVPYGNGNSQQGEASQDSRDK